MWQGWIDLAAGIWLIICGFIPLLRTPVSMLVGGAVVFIFGFWGASRNNSWQGTINGIIGAWLFLSAIWFNLVVTWNFFIFGAVIAILAIWNVTEHSEPSHISV